MSIMEVVNIWKQLLSSSSWLVPAVGTLAAVVFTSSFMSTAWLLRSLHAATDHMLDLPQAILVLGGDKHREKLGAKFAAGTSSTVHNRSKHALNVKLLPIYVSSAHDDANLVFKRARIHPSRIHIDNQALDTVTNFTTMLETFKRQRFTHVYIVTSDYHMERAAMLAGIILCTAGVTYTAISLPSLPAQRLNGSEGFLRRERDRLRALLWCATGWHGAEFLRFTKPDRYREHKKKDVEPVDDANN